MTFSHPTVKYSGRENSSAGQTYLILSKLSLEKGQMVSIKRVTLHVSLLIADIASSIGSRRGCDREQGSKNWRDSHT